MEKNILLTKRKKEDQKFHLMKRLLPWPKLKKVNNNNNNEITINNKSVTERKIRNPGIDLVRILSMYAIIVHHVLYFGDLFKKYDKYKELILMNITCFWHVSSYALISGFIGYKTNKYSNLLYLWICVYFIQQVLFIFMEYLNQMIFKKYN